MKLFLFVVLCVMSSVTSASVEKYVRHSNFSGEISDVALREMCRRYDIRPASEGGGAMNVIRSMSYSFDTYRPYSIEEARRMTVDCTEIFLAAINGCRKARPYFVEFPMSVNRIGLTFFVRYPHTYELRHENSVSIISLRADKDCIVKIIYELEERGAALGAPWTLLHEETFEEAQKIVHEELKKDPTILQKLYKPSFFQPEEPQKNSAEGFIAKIKKLMRISSSFELEPKYIGPERLQDISLDNFCCKLGEPEGLEFVCVGDFSGIMGRFYTYAFPFIGSKKLNLDQARSLGLRLMKGIIQELRTNEEVKKHRTYIWEDKKYYATDPSKEIPRDKIAMKVTFWDEKFDRIMPPHIAQILFLDEKLQYFTADPETQKLVLLFEEPLPKDL